MLDPLRANILAPPPTETLPGKLLAHAQKRAPSPDRAFIEVWSEETGVTQSVTYRELSECMLSAALWLSGAVGLQRGEGCAMLAHNSIGYLCISLGAMCLGAVSLNLNWRQPSSTTRTLLSDLSGFTLIRVIVASKPFKETAQEMHRELGINLLLIEGVCAPEPDLPFPPIADLEASAQLRRQIAELPAAAPCAVFFTGGTTGTPKAVPHTHASLLWFANANLQLFPEPFSERVRHAGTVCFTPYFHVMGFVANFVFNLHAGVRSFILASHDAKLSAPLMLAAIADLKPSCCNTIPYIVEGMVELIKSHHPGAVEALSSLHLLTYGGAALPPHCAPILAMHGITVACTYGQTELAGPVMFGRPGGDPNALRPFPGVSYELVLGKEEEEGVGELVLIGNGSATEGYLNLKSDTRAHRSLTGEPSDSRTTTADRFCTGDRFRECTIDGGKWLLYLCRADDLLVHTSGEMTNPLPTEQMMLAACAGLVDAVACVGNHCARPLMLMELAPTADLASASVAARLQAGLAEANKGQPGYSHVRPQHVVIFPPGTLPRTVKGTVQRPTAELIFAEDLAAVRRNEPPVTFGTRVLAPLVSAESATVDDSYDSLAVAAAGGRGRAGAGGGRGGGGGAGTQALDHLTGIRTLGCLWIVCAHFAFRQPKLAFTDALLERAHLTASAFVVMSGFGMMWAHGATAAPSRSLGRWYVARLHRVLVAYWAAMLLTVAVEHWAAGTVYPASRLLPCACLTATWDTSRAIPNWRLCPNGPAWYIAALVPSWLLFPFIAPLLRQAARLGGVPLALLVLILCLLSYLPVATVMSWPGFDKPDSNGGNLMFYFPPANLADFYAGAAAAALAKLHKPAVTRRLGVPDVGAKQPQPQQQQQQQQQQRLGAHGGLLAGWRRRWAPIAWGLTTDLCMGLFIKLAAHGVSDHAGEMALYHSSTLPVACYLYLSVASGGLGLTSGFLRHASLVALGEYALHVYLFQEPFAQLFAYCLGTEGKLEGQFSTTPWRALRSDAFVAYVVALWAVSGAYVAWFEGAVLGVLQRLATALLCCRRGSATGESGRSTRPGSPVPTAQQL